jgi:multidrug efflux pump subunit AcrA (membrane-fusion protein)
VKQCEQLAQDKYAQAQAQAASSDRSAQAQLASTQTQVSSATNQLDKANAQLVAAQHTLSSTTTQAVLTAPAAATVAAMTGVVGQNASAGGSSSTAFMTLIDAGTLTIAAQVNEADIGNVQVGQSAHFTLAAYPASTFRATVSGIDLLGQTTSNVVTYTVDLTVDSNSLQNVHPYPGMTATVNIATAQRIGALLLPASALSFTSTALQTGEVQRSALTALTRGSSSSGTQSATSGSRVVLTLVNGKLTPVLITTGLSNGQYVEVLSGLHEGDQVVVSQTGGTSSTSSGTRSSGGSLNSGTFNGGGSGTRLSGSGG